MLYVTDTATRTRTDGHLPGLGYRAHIGVRDTVRCGYGFKRPEWVWDGSQKPLLGAWHAARPHNYAMNVGDFACGCRTARRAETRLR